MKKSELLKRIELLEAEVKALTAMVGALNRNPQLFPDLNRMPVYPYTPYHPSPTTVPDWTRPMEITCGDLTRHCI